VRGGRSTRVGEDDPSAVIAGHDPIHLISQDRFAKTMDAQVTPAHDGRQNPRD
jgi:hypothetical protein